MPPAHVYLEDAFSTIGGIPTHPLVVHFVVVLVPLGALGAIAVLLIPFLRTRFDILVWLGLAAGLVASILARQTGETLKDAIGAAADTELVSRHADLGESFPWVVAALLVAYSASAAWLRWGRRLPVRWRPGGGSGGWSGGWPARSLAVGMGMATIGLAIATIILVVQVGDSGARAVWQGRFGPSGG